VLFSLAWTLAFAGQTQPEAAQMSPTAPAAVGQPKVGAAAPISAPLRASKNPNYFQDASGTPLILCGSHTWNTVQDWGTNGTVQPVDFDAFVRFLKEHGHNFTLLWYTELPQHRRLPSTAKAPPDFTVSPHPWMRTGPRRQGILCGGAST
jgi:hypothetical protein